MFLIFKSDQQNMYVKFNYMVLVFKNISSNPKCKT